LLRSLSRGRPPPPEVHGPEAPVVVVDDSVTACRRPWVDAENFHGQRLGAPADVPADAEPLRKS